MRRKNMFVAGMLMFSGIAFAQERPWDATISLGYVGTTGNTDTTTFNAEALLTYNSLRWTHNGKFQGLGAQENDITKAERYYLEEKSDFNLDENMPVMMALLAFWYHNFCQAESQVILPYAQNLHLFPAFLQQLDMESLGKQVQTNSQPLRIVSGGIIWGSAGTNGQHSFHQLLHQGTHLIPADFIAVRESTSSNQEMHDNLLANCLAQSQALMDGMSLQKATAELLAQGMSEADANFLAPHRVVPGNRPSNTLLLERLDPGTLGALTALYEHKVYAHSVLLGINAFDQWGVELGKVLGTGIYKAITAEQECRIFDSSTNALVNRVRQK